MPIIGITNIALDAVKMSVDPRAVRVVAVQDNLMSLIPIVTGPSQRCQDRH